MARMLTARRLLLVLSEREYQQLKHDAERDTRSPDQQAVHLLRQALRPPTRVRAFQRHKWARWAMLARSTKQAHAAPVCVVDTDYQCLAAALARLAAAWWRTRLDTESRDSEPPIESTRQEAA